LAQVSNIEEKKSFLFPVNNIVLRVSCFCDIILSLQVMKNFVLISLFCLIFSGVVSAQEKPVGDDEPGNKPSQPTLPNSKPVKRVIRSWVLENQNSGIRPVVLDTGNTNFHNYTPIYQKSISNTYLGYFGAPANSNLFFDRIEHSDFYFFNSLQAYRFSQRDVNYFNTTIPFSYLKYEQGGEDEQLFNAFFTQNIDSVTNVGFRYNSLKGIGQYKNQEASHKYLNLFFSRNSERYNGYASLITGTNKVVENGGIADSAMDVSVDPLSFSTGLGGTLGPTIKTFSFFTSHEYLLGGISRFHDRQDSLFVPRYGVQYSLEINNYKRNLSESLAEDDFFDTIYFVAKTNRVDSSSLRRFTQIVQIKAFENKLKKFTFGKRIFLENEIVRATHPVLSGYRKYNYSTLFLGGEISNTTSNFLQWNALARFAVLGRNLGDAMVEGSLYKPIRLFRDTLVFTADGWYQDISPDIFQEHWQDNHFKWENNFSKQHEVVLKAELDWERFKLMAGFNYALLGNYLYNGYNSLPAQYSGVFSVISFRLNKEFNLGPLGWNNKLVLQQVSSDSVLHIPALNYYTSIYFKGTLFKVMKLKIGAEMYYHSKFHADKYEPSTSRFYLQNDMLTGGYPQLNAFVNAKLKRTSAFVQLMHFNSSFSGKNFFSSPFYPINQMAFRFGFLWSFYD